MHQLEKPSGSPIENHELDRKDNAAHDADSNLGGDINRPVKPQRSATDGCPVRDAASCVADVHPQKSYLITMEFKGINSPAFLGGYLLYLYPSYNSNIQSRPLTHSMYIPKMNVSSYSP